MGDAVASGSRGEGAGGGSLWRRLVRLGRRLFQGWMAIAAHFGFVQTMLILALFYALLIGPIGVALTLARRDPLDKASLRQTGSAWRQSDSGAPDLERAKLLS